MLFKYICTSVIVKSFIIIYFICFHEFRKLNLKFTHKNRIIHTVSYKFHHFNKVSTVVLPNPPGLLMFLFDKVIS